MPGLAMSGRLDSNQRPPEPHSAPSASQESVHHGDAVSVPPVCTPVCTDKQKQPASTSLEVLAAALLGLSPEDRARLVSLLLGQHPGTTTPAPRPAESGP